MNALSKVTLGWTGSITIEDTGSALSVTVTPTGNESALSVFLRLRNLVSDLLPGVWIFGTTSAMKLTIATDGDPFDLTVSGTTGTRLGFISLSTLSSIQASTAAYETTQPGGLNWSTKRDWSDGKPTFDGSGVQAPAKYNDSVTLQLWDDYDQIWNHEESLIGTYDVWSYEAGVLLLRLRARIRSWSRRQMGLLPSAVTITADCEGVA